MVVSLTIVRYPKRNIPLALLAMAVHRVLIRKQQDCTFYKLLGSGKNGSFDINPDWQQWGLLATWKNTEAADQFFADSTIAGWWKRYCAEQWTVLLNPLQSHGKWDGAEPFGSPGLSIKGPVAVLTRATIRPNRLKNFWKHVNQSAQLMKRSKGFIMSLGVGEAPFFRQATFSVWNDIESVKAFAYGSKEHAEVIRKTRAEKWYSEELFARFKPLRSWGTIKGIDPLKDQII